MTEFEQAVINEVKRVRTFINKADLCNRFEFSISAIGRVSDGDVEIKFNVELDYNRVVEANSVDGALYEALRRLGWQRTNSPLCLPVVEDEPKATDITGVAI
jgi:hypothetical protein